MKVVNEYVSIGYSIAQKDIATRLIQNNMEIDFVSEATGLSSEKVEQIKFNNSQYVKKIIQNMINEEIGEYKIATLLGINIDIVREVMNEK